MAVASIPGPQAAQASGDPERTQTLDLFSEKGITWLHGHGHNDPHHVFRVEGNTLHISGNGWGYWRTAQEFEDFTLEVEFKWGKQVLREGKARDSGIFVHTAGPDGNSHDGNGAFRAGIEVNVFEGAVGDLLLIRGDDAAGKLIAPALIVETGSTDDEGWPFWKENGPARELSRMGRLNRKGKSRAWKDKSGVAADAALERDSWNQLKISVEEGILRVWLNGEWVNEAQIVQPRRGALLFQCEGAEITYRNARLTLPARQGCR